MNAKMAKLVKTKKYSEYAEQLGTLTKNNGE